MYLKTSPAVAYHRLQTRGRVEEAAITLDYLVELDRYHNEWLDELQRLYHLRLTDVPVWNMSFPSHLFISLLVLISCFLLFLGFYHKCRSYSGCTDW